MSRVVLISTYELGRQPFGLASPAAWLRRAGADVVVQDLAVSGFDPQSVSGAALVGVFVPMHTATRMAEQVIARVRQIAPQTHICVYGLYATANAGHLRAFGADSFVSGEFEQPLADLYRSLTGAGPPALTDPVISLARQDFLVPDRSGLPGLDNYARLRTAGGELKIAGSTEATRGCKHVCRHCPIVPVYGGRFRVVPQQVVLEDIRRQVEAGAAHITFGDPDFLNAPAHATRIVTGLHERFPDLTYDVTVKVEHLRKHAALLPVLKQTGCALVTSAVESFDDTILDRLDKRHTAHDLERALEALSVAGLGFNPTFVAFTPWTTLAGYAHFLDRVHTLGLVDLVSPVQYGIRLLIPAGSRMLQLDDIPRLIGGFDPAALAYPWQHPDPRVDALQRSIVDLVAAAPEPGSPGTAPGPTSPPPRDAGTAASPHEPPAASRRAIFARVWDATHTLLGDGRPAPDLGRSPSAAPVAQLTETWYCCAEPTERQLEALL